MIPLNFSKDALPYAYAFTGAFLGSLSIEKVLGKDLSSYAPWISFGLGSVAAWALRSRVSPLAPMAGIGLYLLYRQLSSEQKPKQLPPVIDLTGLKDVVVNTLFKPPGVNEPNATALLVFSGTRHLLLLGEKPLLADFEASLDSLPGLSPCVVAQVDVPCQEQLLQSVKQKGKQIQGISSPIVALEITPAATSVASTEAQVSLGKLLRQEVRQTHVGSLNIRRVDSNWRSGGVAGLAFETDLISVWMHEKDTAAVEQGRKGCEQTQKQWQEQRQGVEQQIKSISTDNEDDPQLLKLRAQLEAIDTTIAEITLRAQELDSQDLHVAKGSTLQIETRLTIEDAPTKQLLLEKARHDQFMLVQTALHALTWDDLEDESGITAQNIHDLILSSLAHLRDKVAVLAARTEMQVQWERYTYKPVIEQTYEEFCAQAYTYDLVTEATVKVVAWKEKLKDDLAWLLQAHHGADAALPGRESYAGFKTTGWEPMLPALRKALREAPNHTRYFLDMRMADRDIYFLTESQRNKSPIVLFKRCVGERVLHSVSPVPTSQDQQPQNYLDRLNEAHMPLGVVDEL